MFSRDLLFRDQTLRRVFFLGGELLHRLEVFRLAFQFAEGIDERPETRHLLDVRLGAFPVRPEIRRGHARFEFA